MAVVELFRALGDTSRLEMMRRLSSGQPYTLNSLSKGLDISRQGARKHLQVLADAKLIVLESKGRDTEVRLERATLDQARAFITDLETKWDMRLESLRRHVEKENKNKSD